MWSGCQQGAHQNEWQKEQMANECVIMKVPKIKREEDCWVIDGRRITPESLGNIFDIIGKKKKLSLKVGHKTLHEFIYLLVGQMKSHYIGPIGVLL